MEEGLKKLKIQLEKEEDIILNIIQVLYLKKYKVLFLEVDSPFIYLEIKDSSSGNGKDVINAIKMLPGIKEVEEVEVIKTGSSRKGENKKEEKVSGSYLKKGNTLHEIIEEVEKEVVTEALNNYKSARKAAKKLGVSHTTVLNKMKKYKDLTGDKEDYEKGYCEICGVKVDEEQARCSDCQVLKIEYEEEKEELEQLLETSQKNIDEDKPENKFQNYNNKDKVVEKNSKANKIQCKNCGITLKYGAVFCHNCFSS